MSSFSSPGANTMHLSGKQKRVVKQQTMSVAERLKMNRSICVRTNFDDDDGSDQPFKVEDGIIDQKLDQLDIRESIELGNYEQSMIRVIAQYLDSLGLKESVEKLVEESGCTVENSYAAKLRSNIFKGNYEAALKIIDQSSPRYLGCDEANQTKFQIQCFKLSNLIRRRQIIDAVYVLKAMYTIINSNDGNKENSKKLDVLNAFICEMFSNKSKYSNIDLSEMRKSQLKTIQCHVPSSFMLPSNRLKSILSKVHGSSCDDEKAEMLLKDDDEKTKRVRYHKCTQVLTEHDSSVWIVKFSPDGRLLVTGSRSNHIILHKIKNGRVIKCGRFEGIPDGSIAYLEWSPQNRFIAVCGPSTCKFNLTVFDVTTRSVHRTIRVQNINDEIGSSLSAYFTCCAFFQSSFNQTLIAANEQGVLRVYDMLSSEESHLIKTINGFRIRCVYGFKDGRRILASDSHNRLRIYHIDSDVETTVINEEATIITFAVHPSEQLVLTTTNLNLRLWDLKSRTLIRYFSGACQQDTFSKYVVHATFGGVNQGFIATGSREPLAGESTSHNQRNIEGCDGRVCIWDFDDCRPILKLKGHKAHVNAVTWNPKDPTMIVSCSDDATVRVYYIDRSITDKISTIVPKRVRRATIDNFKSVATLKNNGTEKNGKSAPNIRTGNDSSSSTSHWTSMTNPKTSHQTSFHHDYDFEASMLEKACE